MNNDSILLVTARHRLMLSTCSSLELSGFQVEATSSRAEALRLVLEEQPALVIVDDVLHFGAAPELCRKLRKRANCSVVVIAEPGQEVRTESLGATAFLAPPVDGNELVDLVTSLLASQPRRRSLEMGLSAILEGRHQVAFELLAQVAGMGRRAPVASWAAYHLSRAHGLRGDLHSSVAVLEELLHTSPEFWRARARLSELKERLNSHELDEQQESHPPLAGLA